MLLEKKEERKEETEEENEKPRIRTFALGRERRTHLN